LVVVLDAICKKITFSANVPIESGQYKRGDIIAQSFRAELWRGRTSGRAVAGDANGGLAISEEFDEVS